MIACAANAIPTEHQLAMIPKSKEAKMAIGVAACSG